MRESEQRLRLGGGSLHGLFEGVGAVHLLVDRGNDFTDFCELRVEPFRCNVEMAT
jgi:hypothetical protein